MGQTPQEQEVVNIANKNKFLLLESSCTYFNVYVCMYTELYILHPLNHNFTEREDYNLEKI
jgi:hypothetical protein